MPDWTPEYDSWRHGGWYVVNVRYPSGACGCVSRQMLNPATGKADRKWRIVCDERPGDRTYPNRDAAAHAEREIAQKRAETRESTCLRCAQRFIVPAGEWMHYCGCERKAEREPQGEAIRLFTPAPNQFDGQLGL